MPERMQAPATRAFVEGWRRALAAPSLVFGVWALTTSVALLVRTAVPAPFLSTGIHGAVWLLLLGGATDRLARARHAGIGTFVAASGRYWPRFVRLGLFTWPVAALLVFLFRQPATANLSWLSGPVMAGAAPIADRGWSAGAFLAGIGLLGVVVDVARVRMVVEDRRSAVAAIPAAIRFMRRRAGRTAGLAALNALAWVAGIGVWRLADPTSAAPGWVTAAIVQAGLLLRVGIRLGALGSVVAFFQAELAPHRFPLDRSLTGSGPRGGSGP